MKDWFQDTKQEPKHVEQFKNNILFLNLTKEYLYIYIFLKSYLLFTIAYIFIIN